MISPTATEIPAEVDVLLVVHPKEFSDELLYSIDQFVLKGGRAVLYLDPHSLKSCRQVSGETETTVIPGQA